MTVWALLRSGTSSTSPPADPARARTWEKVAARLRAAEQSGTQAGERHLQRIHAFFAEKQQHARAFADEVLGWGGKWAYLKGKLFGDEGKGHQEFLRRAFEKHLFTHTDLQQLLEGTVTGYLSELGGDENTLLVLIRADLSEEDLPALRTLAFLDSDAAFGREYQQLLAEVVPVISRDLKIAVGREVAVWVGSEIAAAVTVRIAAAVAVRLGVSGGILGTGAASGVGTLGIGLVLGFVIDGAADWIMRQAGYDPSGQIAGHTCAALARIQDMLVNGDPDAHGVYQKLRRLQDADPVSFVRAECRHAADSMDAGGALGLRHELNRLRQLRERLREAALKKLVFERGAP